MASKPKVLRSAAATARLLVTMAQLLGEESSPPREISRYKFGSATIRKAAGQRSYLTLPFLADLAEESTQIGWLLITISTDQFALLRADKAAAWLQISTKRLSTHFSELPAQGATAMAFRSFLEDDSHPLVCISQMSDEDIIDVFDSMNDEGEDEESEE